MGWNQVTIRRRAPILEGLQEGDYFYFVHSYYVVPNDPAVVALETDYGGPFCSMIWRDNLFGYTVSPGEESGGGTACAGELCARWYADSGGPRMMVARRGWRGGIAVVAGLCHACRGCRPPARMDRLQLLEFHDAERARCSRSQPRTSGNVRRAEIVAGMQEVMGDVAQPRPARAARSCKSSRRWMREAHVRRLVTYQSEAGFAYARVSVHPQGCVGRARRAPAVLCLHPTDNQVGHQVVVGLGGRSGRQYAAELAERGYVTISPSYPHLANYWPNLEQLGYVSGTMKAIWDNMRAVDLLASLPGSGYVARSRGHRPLAGRPQRDLHGRRSTRALRSW